jgi:PTS system fructose-specific IIA component/PTS system nitrogen regulatory IIA component
LWFGLLPVFRLADIIPQGAILVPLTSGDREGVIRELVRALARSGGMPPALEKDIAERVIERERKSSTGFGRGVAVPHAKHPGVTRMAAAIGVSPRGLDFTSLDRQPVYSVFLLVSPDDRPEDHLAAMDAIFRHHVSKESFRRAVRAAASEAQVRDLLLTSDDAQLPA